MLAAAKDLRFASQPTRLASERARLPVEVWQLVCLCDGTRSLTALQAESGLSRRTLEAALAKLEKLGVVQRMKPRRGTVPAPTHLLEWASRRPAKRTVEIEVELHDATATGMSELLTEAPLAIEFSSDEEAFFSQTIEHLLEPEERYTGSLDL